MPIMKRAIPLVASSLVDLNPKRLLLWLNAIGARRRTLPTQLSHHNGERFARRRRAARTPAGRSGLTCVAFFRQLQPPPAPPPQSRLSSQPAEPKSAELRSSLAARPPAHAAAVPNHQLEPSFGAALAADGGGCCVIQEPLAADQLGTRAASRSCVRRSLGRRQQRSWRAAAAAVWRVGAANKAAPLLISRGCDADRLPLRPPPLRPSASSARARAALNCSAGCSARGPAVGGQGASSLVLLSRAPFIASVSLFYALDSVIAGPPNPRRFQHQHSMCSNTAAAAVVLEASTPTL